MNDAETLFEFYMDSVLSFFILYFPIVASAILAFHGLRHIWNRRIHGTLFLLLAVSMFFVNDVVRVFLLGTTY